MSISAFSVQDSLLRRVAPGVPRLLRRVLLASSLALTCPAVASAQSETALDYDLYMIEETGEVLFLYLPAGHCALYEDFNTGAADFYRDYGAQAAGNDSRLMLMSIPCDELPDGDETPDPSEWAAWTLVTAEDGSPFELPAGTNRAGAIRLAETRLSTDPSLRENGTDVSHDDVAFYSQSGPTPEDSTTLPAVFATTMAMNRLVTLTLVSMHDTPASEMRATKQAMKDAVTPVMSATLEENDYSSYSVAEADADDATDSDTTDYSSGFDPLLALDGLTPPIYWPYVLPRFLAAALIGTAFWAGIGAALGAMRRKRRG